MINRVVLTGRLTKDPELRVTQNQMQICNFTLAINRRFKDANGETQADFINCIAFKKTAEIIKQYLTKGSLTGVEGRLQSRSYENKEGQRVFVTEVIVDNVTFLESNNNNSNNHNNQYQQNNYQQTQQKYNQQPNVATGNNSFSNSDSVTDADLPF